MWNWPYGMLCHWDDWGWFWPFHFVLPVAFWALVIAGVVMVVRYASGWSAHPPLLVSRPRGLDVLAERYTRGEINREEFLQKKRDISG